MTIRSTRREFLGLLGVSLPAAEPPTNQASHAKATFSPQGKLNLFVTDSRHKLSPHGEIEWTTADAADVSETITLNPVRHYQPILGFGAAFSDASCYLFSQLARPAREELFRKLFDPTQMAFNVCRTCMGSADSATKLYSYDEGEVDPELMRFSIEHDREYILPILREARSVNPDLFLFSSPWSPPGWMKSNGSLLGGCMRHTYMPSYANYFLKFLRAYEAENIPIQAVTVQNEVDTDQDGTMPACAWPQDYEADFVIQHLGPLFERSGVRTKIWILDHNYDLWGRVLGQLDTPDVLKYTNAVAWHGYAGTPDWINRVQDAFPQVEMYFTEGNSHYRAPEYQSDWAKWGKSFTEILRNCCRSITTWNFVTDERGRPYLGDDPNGVGGAMIIDSRTKEISYSGMFWALGNFSSFVRRGANRIDSQNAGTEISQCAFQNPDGSLVVVVTNPGSNRACDIRLGDKSAKCSLAADSVTTLTCPRPAGT